MGRPLTNAEQASGVIDFGVLPAGSQERKDIPLARGVLDYFPAALAAVAELSRAGNEKHNPGEEMHHARGKSTDHADCIARHLVDRGTVDPEDGIRHSVKVAWRALALLQEELEAAGAPLARGARLPEDDLPVDAKLPQSDGDASWLYREDEKYDRFLDEHTKEPDDACTNPGVGCEGCLCKPAFGIETDPNGTKYRRTGEYHLIRHGEYWLTPRGYVCGPSTCDDPYLYRTIVERV